MTGLLCARRCPASGCYLVCKSVSRRKSLFSLGIDRAQQSIPNSVMTSYILTASTKALECGLMQFLEADKTGFESWFQFGAWASVFLSRKQGLFVEQRLSNYCGPSPAIRLILCDPWTKNSFTFVKECKNKHKLATTTKKTSLKGERGREMQPESLCGPKTKTSSLLWDSLQTPILESDCLGLNPCGLLLVVSSWVNYPTSVI